MDGITNKKWPDFRLIPRSDGAWIATSENPGLGASGATQEEACERLASVMALVLRLARPGATEPG